MATMKTPRKTRKTVKLPDDFIAMKGWKLSTTHTTKCDEESQGRHHVTDDNPAQICQSCTLTRCWNCQQLLGMNHSCLGTFRTCSPVDSGAIPSGASANKTASTGPVKGLFSNKGLSVGRQRPSNLNQTTTYVDNDISPLARQKGKKLEEFNAETESEGSNSAFNALNKPLASKTTIAAERKRKVAHLTTPPTIESNVGKTQPESKLKRPYNRKAKIVPNLSINAPPESENTPKANPTEQEAIRGLLDLSRRQYSGAQFRPETMNQHEPKENETRPLNFSTDNQTISGSLNSPSSATVPPPKSSSDVPLTRMARLEAEIWWERYGHEVDANQNKYLD